MEQMDKKTIKVLNIASYVIGFVGVVLLTAYGSWQLALGAFLLIWGNNLRQAVSIAQGMEKLVQVFFTAFERYQASKAGVNYTTTKE